MTNTDYPQTWLSRDVHSEKTSKAEQQAKKHTAYRVLAEQRPKTCLSSMFGHSVTEYDFHNGLHFPKSHPSLWPRSCHGNLEWKQEGHKCSGTVWSGQRWLKSVKTRNCQEVPLYWCHNDTQRLCMVLNGLSTCVRRTAISQWEKKQWMGQPQT